MLNWFLNLSLMGKLWLIYAILGPLAFGVATYIDLTKWKVGWLMLMAMLCVGGIGIVLLIITGVVSLFS